MGIPNKGLFKGTGFVKTASEKESVEYAITLVRAGFIHESYAAIEGGLMFFYTEKGIAFANAVKEDTQLTGMTPEEYIDMYIKLQSEGGSDGNETGLPDKK